MKQNRWTKEEDKALIELVKIYGPHKWADISRAIKQVYGIDRNPRMVQHRWPSLDPTANRKEYRQDELLKAWELYKLHENNWQFLTANMEG